MLVQRAKAVFVLGMTNKDKAGLAKLPKPVFLPEKNPNFFAVDTMTLTPAETQRTITEEVQVTVLKPTFSFCSLRRQQNRTLYLPFIMS